MTDFLTFRLLLKKSSIYFIKIAVAAFLLYALVIFKLGVIDIEPNVEWGFYQSYTNSLIQDYDFNILNNIPENAAWIVSSTFNYPEMHDNGAPILWAPIVKFFELFNLQDILVTPDLKFNQSSAIYFIINLILFLIAFYLLKKLTENLLKKQIFYISSLFVLFGTGLFYYLFIEYTGTEITLFFYTTLVLTYCSQITKSDRLFYYLLFGIFFGYGRIIKIHFLTYLIPFLYFYWTNNKLENYKHHLKRIFLFLIGFCSLTLLLEYNNYLKFGFINLGQGYAAEFSIDSFFKIQDVLITYIGPLGFFYLTPVFFFSFILYFYGLYKWFFKKNICSLEKIGIVLYSSVILKLLALLFVPTPGLCEFGERNFIIDSSAHFFLISAFLNNIKNRITKLLFIFILLSSCIWTLINFFWQREVMSWVPNQQMAHYIWSYKIVFHEIQLHFDRFKYSCYFLISYFLKNINLFYLCLFCSIFIIHLKYLINKIFNKRTMSLISFSLFFLYLFVTILNGYNNPINSARMRLDSKYSKILVGNGPHIFTYDNVATDLIPMMELDKFLRNKDEFNFKKIWFEKFLSVASQEILVDNVGFIKSQKQNRLPKIGVYTQMEDYDIFKYEIPARFKVKSAEF